MRPITKFALGLIAVIGILQSLAVAAVIWPTIPIKVWILPIWPWLRITLLVGTAIVLAVFVVMLGVAIFRRSKRQDLTLEANQGSVVLSKQALEHKLVKTIASEHPVKDVAADISLYRKNAATKVVVDAYSLKGLDLAEEGKRIETTAQTVLTNLLGVPVKRVVVHLHTNDRAMPGTV